MIKTDHGHKLIRGRAAKKSALRQQIYDTAIRLFRSRGYDATTVHDVTSALDVAKGTFFNYFPSKEHVLVAYQRAMGGEILATMRAKRFRSAERAVQSALGECASWAQNDPAIGRVLIRTIFVSDVTLAADEENEADLTTYLAEQLNGGLARGELKATTDVSLFISCAIGLLSATVTEWVAGDCAFDIERVLARKITLLFDAIRVST